MRTTSFRSLSNYVRNQILPNRKDSVDTSLGRYSTIEKIQDAFYFLTLMPSLKRDSSKVPSLHSRLRAEWSPDTGVLALGDLFTSYGSDKSTHHDYHLLYAELVGRKRFHLTSVIEIGIGSIDLLTPQNMGLNGSPGASLRAFRDWAPQAEVIGADIDEKTLFTEQRIQTCRVNQLERNSFQDLKKKMSSGVDLIVVDGLHTPRAEINTLLELLPYLRSDGCLVIEDISRKSALLLWPFAKLMLRHRFDPSIRKMKNGYVFVLISRI